MERMVFVTGLRPAKAHLNYNGRLNRLTASVDPPAEDCYFCHGLFTGEQQSNIERYFGLDLGRVPGSSGTAAL
jgi:hypothetical protein